MTSFELETEGFATTYNEVHALLQQVRMQREMAQDSVQGVSGYDATTQVYGVARTLFTRRDQASSVVNELINLENRLVEWLEGAHEAYYGYLGDDEAAAVGSSKAQGA
ncbi:hypothetical protein GCM10027425_19960 [Alteromonas gracilis]